MPTPDPALKVQVPHRWGEPREQGRCRRPRQPRWLNHDVHLLPTSPAGSGSWRAAPTVRIAEASPS